MVLWKDEYGVGIPAIDGQHKHLFDIANRISELLANELLVDKYDHIIAVLSELRDYTVEHFAAEEAYMLEHKYRKFLSHKALHQDFIEKITTVDLNQIDNEQNLYLKDILNFVTEWLISHILQEDKQIVRLSEK
jgi:hemerythrin